MSAPDVCPCCGSEPDANERRAGLLFCPFCGGDKCECCDMGDDVPCRACEELEEATP